MDTMITPTPKKEQGEKYPATIYNVSLVDGDYGEQLLVKLVEPNENVERRYLPLPMTEKNRTGRWFTALLGGYPSGVTDEQQLVGMTVWMIYGPKFRAPEETVLDAVKPRTPDKGEDPSATVAKAIEADDMEAPF